MTGLAIIAAVFVLCFGLCAFFAGAWVYFAGTQGIRPLPAIGPWKGERIVAYGGDETDELLERTPV